MGGGRGERACWNLAIRRYDAHLKVLLHCLDGIRVAEARLVRDILPVPNKVNDARAQAHARTLPVDSRDTQRTESDVLVAEDGVNFRRTARALCEHNNGLGCSLGDGHRHPRRRAVHVRELLDDVRVKQRLEIEAANDGLGDEAFYRRACIRWEGRNLLLASGLDSGGLRRNPRLLLCCQARNLSCGSLLSCNTLRLDASELGEAGLLGSLRCFALQSLGRLIILLTLPRKRRRGGGRGAGRGKWVSSRSDGGLTLGGGRARRGRTTTSEPMPNSYAAGFPPPRDASRRRMISASESSACDVICIEPATPAKYASTGVLIALNATFRRSGAVFGVHETKKNLACFTPPSMAYTRRTANTI